MRNWIHIDPWVYLTAALLVLVLPLDWLMAALCAAVFHEICHIAAIRLLGGSVKGIRIGIGGAAIETEVPGRGRELLSALAGPAGSMLLLPLCHLFPKIALCAFAQGAFNLLPIFPMDGGRALRCCAEMIAPSKAETILNFAEISTYLTIILHAAGVTALFSVGILPLFGAILLILKAISRKRPCKRRRIGVQ